ncbi:universal stress protein [Halomicrobium salinisoli]|uniref:universal stress protein n=1 Tax=Halomicrobium salinisoli TaxID=2878391 RepID=UPI001CF09D98|nr:universal stress protein [Halomicrobium salinisoli]
MYQIVAGIDASEDRAAAAADAITDLPLADDSARVTLLHAFDDGEEGSVEDVPSVRRARDALAEADLEVTCAGATGDPADAIMERADEVDADMIVVAGRKRTPAGKVLFGSVTQSVILGTDRPVFVCSAGEVL